MESVKKPRLDLENKFNSTSDGPSGSRSGPGQFPKTEGSKISRENQNSSIDALLFDNSSVKRSECGYGIECYRRNPQHLKDYRHSELEALFVRMRNEGDKFLTPEVIAGFTNKEVLLEQLNVLRDFRLEITGQKSSSSSSGTHSPSTSGSSSTAELKRKSESITGSNVQYKMKIESSTSDEMLAKLEASRPFNFFLTKIPQERSSTPLSISFRDLFHPSLGKVKAVCHFNFMVEGRWFIEETLEAQLEDVEMTVIYGVLNPELEQSKRAFPWLKVYLMKSPHPYGHHHTKMMFIKYDDDSLRFIVSTANLIESDWDNRTQGVWVGPRCPGQVKEGQTGESVTNFRSDLLQYLSTYPRKYVGDWSTAIQACDCTQIKVAFVGSAPITSLSSITGFNLGLKKLDKHLRNAVSKVDADWPLLIQCSSIATLGTSDDWIRNEVAGNMMGGSHRNTFPICVIYPSLSNVTESFDGLLGGGCLPYTRDTHAKQQWVQNMMYQWKSDSRQRTRAMPHIKTYCRISPDRTKLAWFLLTSANLSKAAWGKLNKARDRLNIMSWEAGVLFIPKYLGSPGQEAFQVSKNPTAMPKDGSEFPVPFDLPLTKYRSNDSPWFIDILRESGELD